MPEMKASKSALELIGNTPLVKLNRISEDAEAEVWVKLEYLNPSGSLKDRIALKMIEEAEETGKLKPGYTIVEGSTGNTGIALAFVGGLKRYRVVIYMPEGMSEERIDIIKRFGGEVELLSVEEEHRIKEKSVYGAEIEVPLRVKCLEIEKSNPRVYWTRQFSNPANVRAHNKTGREILDQIAGQVDVFVAAVGTGGTLLGVTEVLKEKYPNVRIVAVEPASARFPLISGHRKVPGASSEVSGGIISTIVDGKIVDEVVRVSDNEAVNMARRLAREEGLFAGMSSGANVLVAVREARKLGKGGRIVTVLPDGMYRYFSSEHFVT